MGDAKTPLLDAGIPLEALPASANGAKLTPSNANFVRVCTYCVLHGDAFRGYRPKGTAWRRVAASIALEPHKLQRLASASRIVEGVLLVLLWVNVGLVLWLTTLDHVTETEVLHTVAAKVFLGATIGIFSVEYMGRLWCCIEDERFSKHGFFLGRVKWAALPLSILDIISLSSIPLWWWLSAKNSEGLTVVRCVRVFRVALLLRMERQASAFSRLRRVWNAARSELLVTLFVAVVSVIISGALMYLCENPYQPQTFSSIPMSMWWAVTALSTVGYGDMVPISAAGRVLATVVAFIGIGLFALPAGILGSRFAEVQAEERQLAAKQNPSFGVAVDASPDDDAEDEGKIDNDGATNLVEENRRLRAEVSELRERLFFVSHCEGGQRKQREGAVDDPIAVASCLAVPCPHCARALNLRLQLA
eukprot:TRINITY_DN12779_c0_g1_i2.p1 TRINITY_DN12779_c0_g1~~TRINITY_DN12779_c0_g1_i2.p1  ORF type:complete len:419 (-),score=66.39 TRINITY_DN12779_c0_g1_i2:29-1285(-)